MRCAKPRRLLTYLALAALLAGCGGGGSVRRAPEPPPSAPVEQPEPEPPPAKEDLEGRFEAALKLMRTGKTQQAIDAFNALSQDAPQFSGPYTNLGVLYAGRNLREAAIGAFSQAVQINPQNKVALNLLGVQYLESGNYLLAEQTWRQALTVDPDYAAAHLNLGMLYEQHLRQPRRAIDEYRAYQRLSDGDALQVDVWVAEIETRMPTAAGMPAPDNGLETGQ